MSERCKFVVVLLLFVMGASPAAVAETTSLRVSLTIVESCQVHVDRPFPAAVPGQPPLRVACTGRQPYQVQHGRTDVQPYAIEPSSPDSSSPAIAAWRVVF